MVENVRWGLYHQPTEKTVKKMMANADAVLGNPLVAELVDRARIEFGRENHFDFPAKLNTLVHKVSTPGELLFLVRWIFAHMLAKRVKDPFSDRELDGKAGVVAQCLWQRSYVAHFLQEHAVIFAKPESAVSADADAGSERQNLWAQARNCLQDPLALREQINRSVTWLQSLPNKPMRLAVAHVADLYRNYYASELKGALAQVPGPAAYKPEKFQAGERVKHRFTTDFEAAAKSYRLEIGFATGADEEAKADPTAASAEADKKKAEDKHGKGLAASACDKQEFRAEVEARVRKDLQARLVVLTKDGGHPELHASVTSTELYHNLLSTGCRFVGIYDPKNAKLCDVFTGEGWAQREPALDESDLQMFMDTMANIMKSGMDFCWLFSGKSEPNANQIKDMITKKGWKYKQFTAVMDYKAMQKYYWRRQRGIANSRTVEKLFLCWVGPLPKHMPMERWYVDSGSPLYVEVMNKVPPVAPKDLAYVDKTVRETSLKRMVALSTEVPAPADDDAEIAAASATPAPLDNRTGPTPHELLQSVKRRPLYRRATGEEVVWFPPTTTTRRS